MNFIATDGSVARWASCCHFPKLNKRAGSQAEGGLTAGFAHRGGATQACILIRRGRTKRWVMQLAENNCPRWAKEMCPLWVTTFPGFTGPEENVEPYLGLPSPHQTQQNASEKWRASNHFLPTSSLGRWGLVEFPMVCVSKIFGKGRKWFLLHIGVFPYKFYSFIHLFSIYRSFSMCQVLC